MIIFPILEKKKITVEFGWSIDVNTRYTIPPYFQSIWQLNHHEYTARDSYSSTIEQHREFYYLVAVYRNLAILL